VRRYRGTIPRVSPLALAETGLALARIDRMARRVDTVRPWAGDEAKRWDSQTFATWINRNVRTPTARDLIRLGIWAVWAVEPEDLSLLHVLFYIRSAGSFSDLLDTEGGAQDSRVVGGTQLICLRMAEELGPEAIELDTPVRRIVTPPQQGSDPLMTVVADRVTVRARKVIVAVPPFLAGRIDYDPAMPAVRDSLTQRMSQGSVVKCMAIYDRPFWRERGLSGQATSADGPISVTYDNSPPDGSPGVLLAFFEAGAARRATELPQSERRRLVLGSLRRFFGPEAEQPAHYVDKAWAADPWSRGCYGGFMPTGAWTSVGAALRPPVGSIHWAGAETATVWNGYMDGAVSSGQRVAAEVAEALG
jgi:monoamine oxidase